MPSKKTRNSIIIATCIAIPFLVLILHLATSPRFVSLSPDSGVFAYAGKLVSEGKVPYRDFFDHKPPLIYYLNALAIYLMGASPWSIWWLDVFYLSITGIVLFLVLLKITDSLSAILGVVIFILTLMTPHYFLGGNLTETYGLLPQILVVGAIFGYLKSKNAWWIFLAGLLTAIASLFKQTNIALGIGALLTLIFLALLSRQPSRAIKHSLIFIVAILLPWLFISVIWASLGSFHQLWDAVVAYNFIYVKSGFSMTSIFLTYQSFMVSIPLMSLMIITIASFCVFLLGIRENFSFYNTMNKADPYRTAAATRELTFLTVYWAIPFEVFFITLSGRNYGHYFISLFPSIIFACCYLFGKLISDIGNKSIGQIASIGFITSLLFAWFLPTFNSVHPQRQHLASLLKIGDKSLAQNDVVSFIESHSQQNDPVLVWQVRPELNLITGRPAPTKYIYPLPLFVENGNEPSRFEEFLLELAANPPRLVLIAKNDSAVPAFDVPDENLCPSCAPNVLDGMKKLKSFILSKYIIIAEINEIRIYERTK
jgi:hypothetical protein